MSDFIARAKEERADDVVESYTSETMPSHVVCYTVDNNKLIQTKSYYMKLAGGRIFNLETFAIARGASYIFYPLPETKKLTLTFQNKAY